MPAQIVVRAIAAGAFEHTRGKIVPSQQAHERIAPGDAAASRQRQHDRHDNRTGMAAAAEIGSP